MADQNGKWNHPHENGKEEKKKKRKREKRVNEQADVTEVHTSPTVSIAVPGSIIDNAQSHELATLLAGQIARAITIFRIDEVIVFDNKADSEGDSFDPEAADSGSNESGASFLVRILLYLETPQYLRRSLFPMHSSMKYVGLLPPLDAPHHLRKHEWCAFREGITLESRDSSVGGTSVNVGLNKNVVVNQNLEPGLRVTVAMGPDRASLEVFPKKVVEPSVPKKELGIYWGYKVRYAPNFSSVFNRCPYKDGYDHVIGTSEHGRVVSSSELCIPAFKHLLIAFGGLAGLEECIEEDSNLKGRSVSDVFHSYLNTCSDQGSRTIRTEEALFICLQYFYEPITRSMQHHGVK